MKEKEMLKIYDSSLKYLKDVERNEAHSKEVIDFLIKELI